MRHRIAAAAIAGWPWRRACRGRRRRRRPRSPSWCPTPSAINNFPLYVALGEGHFEEEGLDVTVQAVNGSAAVLQTMASGQAEIGNPGPGPLLAARARGEDVVFIYNQFPKSIFGLVVREESEVQSPADLEGTVIGVGTADGAEVSFTRGIMSDQGFQEGEDYEFLAIGDGGTAVAAFLNDEVEAYAAAVSDARDHRGARHPAARDHTRGTTSATSETAGR